MNEKEPPKTKKKSSSIFEGKKYNSIILFVMVLAIIVSIILAIFTSKIGKNKEDKPTISLLDTTGTVIINSGDINLYYPEEESIEKSNKISGDVDRSVLEDSDTALEELVYKKDAVINSNEKPKDVPVQGEQLTSTDIQASDDRINIYLYSNDADESVSKRMVYRTKNWRITIGDGDISYTVDTKAKISGSNTNNDLIKWGRIYKLLLSENPGDINKSNITSILTSDGVVKIDAIMDIVMICGDQEEVIANDVATLDYMLNYEWSPETQNDLAKYFNRKISYKKQSIVNLELYDLNRDI